MMTYFFIIIFSVLLAAFFSGGETAFISVKFMKLIHLIEKKDKAALRLHKLLKRPDTLLTTTLIGTNISVIVASAYTTELLFGFSPQAASFLATCLLSPVILVFGEIIPKTICQNRPNQIALFIAPLFVMMQKILWPIIAIVRGITNSLLRFVSPRTIRKNPFLTRDEIKSLIRDVSKEGIIEDYERSVIDGIFDFTLTKAADIMVGLRDVALIDYSDSRDTVLEKSRKFGFTRLPVFEGHAVRGVVNIFDLFYNDQIRDWHEFIRPISAVFFDERLDKVFSVMQPNKETMVAVFKNDRCIGILTMEDLIDEIIHRAKPMMESAKQ